MSNADQTPKKSKPSFKDRYETRLGSRGNSFTPDGGKHDPASTPSESNKNKNSKKNKELTPQERATNWRKNRREVFADQRRAASIFRDFSARRDAEWQEVFAAQGMDDADPTLELPNMDKLAGRGVTLCGYSQIPDMDTRLMRRVKDGQIRANMTGTQMCGLRWVCPVCTVKRGNEDRQTINDALSAARKRGLFPVMLTLTTRHSYDEKAADVLGGIMTAEQRLKRLKCWRRVMDESHGYARVLEWTYGKNGHHPHFHTILIMHAKDESEAIEKVETLRGAYMRQLTAAGRDGESADAMLRSFHVQGARAAENYITKWGLAEELTGATAKDSKEGFTPWQILRLSRTAEGRGKKTAEQERARFAAIWFEIIQATKGKAQLYKSEDFKKLAKLGASETPAEPEPEELMNFGARKGREASELWQTAVVRRIPILEAAESNASPALAKRAVLAAMADDLTDDRIMRSLCDEEELLPLIEQPEGPPTQGPPEGPPTQGPPEGPPTQGPPEGR